MNEERIVAYLNTLYPELPEPLLKIEQRALKDHVPIISRDTQNLLRLLLHMQRPGRILEVGTAVGFSALFMEAVNPVPCNIVTIENYQKRISVARENFAALGKEDCIALLEGDAGELLPTLSEPYDFIFMDAAKGQYIRLLPQMKRLMHPGSMLVTDNVLQGGDILESHYVVTRRNRTIHKRMREYLYAQTHDKELVSSVLTVGDGVAVCVRR